MLAPREVVTTSTVIISSLLVFICNKLPQILAVLGAVGFHIPLYGQQKES
jgi:hypothetical protein